MHLCHACLVTSMPDFSVGDIVVCTNDKPSLGLQVGDKGIIMCMYNYNASVHFFKWSHESGRDWDRSVADTHAANGKEAFYFTLDNLRLAKLCMFGSEPRHE